MTSNRYYLVDLPKSGSPVRLDTALTVMARVAGKRERACDIGHYRLSANGQQAIVQAALDDEERSWLLLHPWVSEIGDRGATLEWISTRTAQWEVNNG